MNSGTCKSDARPRQAPGGVPTETLATDRTGAVYFESLITIPILLVFFFSIVQLAYLSVASLLVKHAAAAAARSAAVILPDCPSAFPDRSRPGTTTGDRLVAIQSAATRVILAMNYLPLLWDRGSGGVSDADVTVDLGSSKQGTVRVYFRAPCTVPAGYLICGGFTKSVGAQATFPLQAGSYAYY